ncbi:MAG: hypothetical protein ACLFR1_02200 [Spirochaetia bacterium]
MVKSELIKRSPLRILEKSIHGGLGKGNIGVIASRKGVGKTACLVHIGTDKLFQEKHVIHVSFSSRTDHIISWYEDIFKEITKKRELEHAMEVHNTIIKNRVIMNFNQDGIQTEQVLHSLKAMIKDGNFGADMVVVDGFDFAKANPEDLQQVKNFAKELNIEIWFSVSLPEGSNFDENGTPMLLKDFLGQISVLVTLKPDNNHIKLQLVKDHGHVPVEELHLILDSKSLLIVEE